ncbi:hypothetical protein ES703_23480 [subsurface metagenome]
MKIINFFKKKKENIKMVNDSDLELYLSSLGLLENIRKRKIHCSFCDQVVTMDNLQVLSPCEDKICVICNKKKCLERL